MARGHLGGASGFAQARTGVAHQCSSRNTKTKRPVVAHATERQRFRQLGGVQDG